MRASHRNRIPAFGAVLASALLLAGCQHAPEWAQGAWDATAQTFEGLSQKVASIGAEDGEAAPSPSAKNKTRAIEPARPGATAAAAAPEGPARARTRPKPPPHRKNPHPDGSGPIGSRTSRNATPPRARTRKPRAPCPMPPSRRTCGPFRGSRSAPAPISGASSRSGPPSSARSPISSFSWATMSMGMWARPTTPRTPI